MAVCFVVADCEGAGGERGVIAEFEMVVDDRQTDRQTDEAATKTMFHHLHQQPFERLRVYIVKLPSLFLFVHLSTFVHAMEGTLLFVSSFSFYFVLSFSSFFPHLFHFSFFFYQFSRILKMRDFF
jgi:hypothetical protein